MIKFSWEKINNKFNWNGYKVLQYFYEKQGIKPTVPLYNTKNLKSFGIADLTTSTVSNAVPHS